MLTPVDEITPKTTEPACAIRLDIDLTRIPNSSRSLATERSAKRRLVRPGAPVNPPGPVQAVDRFGQRGVAGVANAADRGCDPGLGQPLAVADRNGLHAAIGVVGQVACVGPRADNACSSTSSTQSRAGRAGHLPAQDASSPQAHHEGHGAEAHPNRTSVKSLTHAGPDDPPGTVDFPGPAGTAAPGCCAWSSRPCSAPPGSLPAATASKPCDPRTPACSRPRPAESECAAHRSARPGPGATPDRLGGPHAYD